MTLEPLFDRPARQVLADARRAMDANRKTSSDGSENASEKFEPEAKGREDGTSQASGIRQTGSGLEKEDGQPDLGSRLVRFSLEGADDASCPDAEVVAGADRAEGRSTLHVLEFRRRGGTVSNTVACGPGATILAFPSPPSQAAVWAW